MANKRRPSLKDVAARANVSWKTVSNVVNDYPGVRPATRERVKQAIDELGYVPNLAGRQLRQGTTRTVVLAVPGFSNPYFARLAELFQVEGQKRGWSVAIVLTGFDRELERRYLTGWGARDADAVIVSPTQLDYIRHEPRVGDIPLVLLGERPADGLIPHVLIDNPAATMDVMKHLMETGRRKIGFVGAPLEHGISTGSRRFDGYRLALRYAGADVDDTFVYRSDSWWRKAGYDGYRAIIESGADPDALVCANDLIAIGAAHAVHESGRKVGQDIAIAGFDNIEEVAWTSPALTSVAPDLTALVQTALDVALGKSEGGPEFSIGHELVIRESTRS